MLVFFWIPLCQVLIWGNCFLTGRIALVLCAFLKILSYLFLVSQHTLLAGVTALWSVSNHSIISSVSLCIQITMLLNTSLASLRVSHVRVFDKLHLQHQHLCLQTPIMFSYLQALVRKLWVRKFISYFPAPWPFIFAPELLILLFAGRLKGRDQPVLIKHISAVPECRDTMALMCPLLCKLQGSY